MNCQQEQIGEARSSERIKVQCTLVFANGRQVGEGRARDVSAHGCLESPVPVKEGDYLQLRLVRPDCDLSACVSLAAVQWVQGLQFGVRFIKVDEKHYARLNNFVTQERENPWRKRYVF